MKILIDNINEQMLAWESVQAKITPKKKIMTLKKILIVEDQTDVRHIIKLALDFDYYEIHEASNAQMGLKMVQAIKPDLVLLDIMMPAQIEVSEPYIVNGLDLCMRLKGDPEYANMPIILLSALGQQRNKDEGLAAGADDYIIKPFSIISLINAVKLHLSKSNNRSNKVNNGNHSKNI